MVDVADLARTCFFCAKPVEGKKDRSREHIVPDFLLDRMDIKRATITGNADFEYAKVKVRAHATCNNGFGSAYENEIKSLLDDLDGLFEELVSDEASTAIDYGPDSSAGFLVSTWLCKIYYGLFYYDLVKTADDTWRRVCADVILSTNFSMIRDSYRNGYGFCLPSSLYAFRSHCTQGFDLKTSVAPAAILLKVDSLVLILAIGDGFLAKQYLREEPLACLRANIELQEEANRDFPGYLLAWAEVLALLLYRLDEEYLSEVREQVLTD